MSKTTKSKQSRDLMRSWALTWRQTGDGFALAMAIGLWQAARDWAANETKG